MLNVHQLQFQKASLTDRAICTDAIASKNIQHKNTNNFLIDDFFIACLISIPMK